MDDNLRILQKAKNYIHLERALILVLQKKNYEEITVKNLVEEAGISRTAFYAQFAGKKEFIDYLINHVHFSAMIVSDDNKSVNGFSKENFIDYYECYFQYIAEHADLYKVMLGNNGLSIFREKMKQEAFDLWRQSYFKMEYVEKLHANEQKETNIILSYIISAQIGVVEYWLENNTEESPQQIAKQLYNMAWPLLEARSNRDFLIL